MLHRLRHAARRWPRLCLGLVLTTFAPQSLAATLDWCLHGTDGVHLASGLVACDDHVVSGAPRAAGITIATEATAVSGAPLPAATDHADDSAEHRQHPARIGATSDGAASPVPAGTAVPLATGWHFLAHVLTLDSAMPRASNRPLASSLPAAPRPRVSGAVHGGSARLLI